MQEFVLNVRRRVLHRRVDGRTHEACNTDAMRHTRVVEPERVGYELADGRFRLCLRDFPGGRLP